jgi:hypothetical protein
MVIKRIIIIIIILTGWGNIFAQDCKECRDKQIIETEKLKKVYKDQKDQENLDKSLNKLRSDKTIVVLCAKGYSGIFDSRRECEDFVRQKKASNNDINDIFYRDLVCMECTGTGNVPTSGIESGENDNSITSYAKDQIAYNTSRDAMDKMLNRFDLNEIQQGKKGQLIIENDGNETAKIPKEDIKGLLAELEETFFIPPISIDKEKVNNLVNQLFLGSPQNANLCDLVKMKFYDVIGYPPEHIDIKATTSNDQKNKIAEYYNNLGKAYADYANYRWNVILEQWKKSLYIPSWTEIYNSINNPQKFVSILGEIGFINDDNLPVLLASNKNYFFLYIEKDNRMAAVQKSGNSLIFISLGGFSANFLLAQSRAGFIYNNTELSIPNQLNSFSVLRKYNLKKDGSFKKISTGKKGSFTVETSGISHSIDLVDIESRSVPMLEYLDKETFIILTNKRSFTISGKTSASLKSIISPINAGIIFDERGNVKGGLLGIEAGIVKANVEGEKTEAGYKGTTSVEVGIVGVEAAAANNSISGGINLGKGVKTGVNLSIGIDNSDILRTLHSLPVEITKKVYIDFLNNPKLHDNNVYNYLYDSKSDQLRKFQYTMTEEDIKIVRAKFMEIMDMKQQNEKSQIIIKETGEVFSPCTLSRIY